MKRLIKKAFGKTLYHGTSFENLKSITEAGMIMPQETEGGGLDTNNDRDAKKRAFNRLWDEGLRPDTPEYNEKYPQYYEQEISKEQSKFDGYTFFAGSMKIANTYVEGKPKVIIEVSVPEESLMPDDNDCPECDTWQESLNYIDQVKVLGTITSDYITGVYIYDSGLDLQNAKFYPKLTWIDNYQEDENQ